MGSRARSQGGGWHTGWESRFCTFRLCKVFNSLHSHLLICMDGDDLGAFGSSVSPHADGPCHRVYGEALATPGHPGRKAGAPLPMGYAVAAAPPALARCMACPAATVFLGIQGLGTCFQDRHLEGNCPHGNGGSVPVSPEGHVLRAQDPKQKGLFQMERFIGRDHQRDPELACALGPPSTQGLWAPCSVSAALRCPPSVLPISNPVST